MESKRHKLSLGFIFLMMIMILGFKDTGIFVKDYMAVKNNGAEVSFAKGENLQVLREGPETFIVLKEEESISVPKDTLIRTTNSSLKYIVIENTPLLDKPEGKMMKMLNANDFITPEKIEGEYGIFLTQDNYSGYVKLDALQTYASEVLTQGISVVNKVIKNENKYYVLTKGDIVAIKDFKDNKFVVVDENGNEFLAEDSFIELRRVREQVSRSSISRKTNVLSKAITSAYSKLGRPYVYADTGNKGFDCSGLTYAIYKNELGISVSRSSAGQSNDGIFVSKADLLPGDLVFFNTTGKGISHVGLYIGDGNMIHASSTKSNARVIVSTIDSGYYSQRYVTGRRIIK